jgi:co-chaperonin GroES (HSP10)
MGTMEEHKIGQTKLKDGALKGMAIVGERNAKITAIGKHVICVIEDAGEFSSGGILLPSGAKEKVVVRSVGSDITIKKADGSPLEVGDCILVAQLTKMQIFNPLSGENEEIAIYHQDHIMGVIEPQ